MFDPVSIGIMAGMAGLNMLKERERQSQLSDYNKGQAEMTKYSPWTGRAGQIQQDTGPGMVGAGAGGALQGLVFSKYLDQSGATPPVQQPSTPTMYNAGQKSYLGGREMAQSLGSGNGFSAPSNMGSQYAYKW